VEVVANPRFLHPGLICWRELAWQTKSGEHIQAVRLTEVAEDPNPGETWSQKWWCQILDQDDEAFGEEVLVNHMYLSATMPPLLQLAYASVI